MNIYSFIEIDGKCFIAPQSEDPIEYLMQVGERHYISASNELPEQHPECDVQGPIDLTVETELKTLLDERSYPNQQIKLRRAESYLPIGDQLDAIIKELAARRTNGETLTAEANAIIDHAFSVKAQYPKRVFVEE